MLYYLISLQPASEDSAVRSEENDFGEAADSVNIGIGLFKVYDLRIWNVFVLDGFQRFHRVIPCGNTKNNQSLVFVLIVDGDEIWYFAATGSTP